MAVVQVDVFEADVFEDGIFSDFTSDYVDRVSVLEKIIYIKKSVTQMHPVDDLYKEVRSLRRIDETIRVINQVSQQGNDPAGANFTPRRAVLNNGWRLALENTVNGFLQFTGEMISDDGKAGSQLVLLDKLPTGVSMLVNYEPPRSEVIEVGTGSGITAQDKIDIVTALFDHVIENGESFADALKLIRANAAGNITANPTTGDYTIKSANGGIDRITGTGSTSGRTIVTDVS